MPKNRKKVNFNKNQVTTEFFTKSYKIFRIQFSFWVNYGSNGCHIITYEHILGYFDEKNLKLKPSKMVISEEVEFAGTAIRAETIQEERCQSERCQSKVGSRSLKTGWMDSKLALAR